MRQIKFRGQRVDNKEWVYGDLVNSFEGVHIVSSSDYFKPSNDQHPELIDVLPKTVGQYTGLNDKNGNEMYEGDIENMHKGVIEFNEETCCYIVRRINRTFVRLEVMKGYIEIIGSIHTNPELIQSIK